jgi:hypothetical protein
LVLPSPCLSPDNISFHQTVKPYGRMRTLIKRNYGNNSHDADSWTGSSILEPLIASRSRLYLSAPKIATIVIPGSGDLSPNRASLAIKKRLPRSVVVSPNLQLFRRCIKEIMLHDENQVEEDAHIAQPQLNRIAHYAAPVCL